MAEPPLPDDVLAATRQHLRALDAAAPGLAGALYVTRSVALGDYQQGHSDIDFMAFLSRPVTDPETVGRLAEVHAGLAGPADYRRRREQALGQANTAVSEPGESASLSRSAPKNVMVGPTIANDPGAGSDGRMPRAASGMTPA